MASNQQRVAYNTAVQIAGRIIDGGLGIVSVGLSTRYLGLNDYGQLATALIFVTLFTALSDAGTGAIAVRELIQSKRRPGEIVGNILLLRGALGLAATLIVLAAGHLVYGGAGHEATRTAINFLAITLLLTTIQSALTATLLANLRNDLLVVGTLLGRFASLGLLVAAVSLDWGFTGVVGAILAGAVVHFLSDSLLGGRRVAPEIRPDWRYTKQILWISAPIGAGTILNSIYFKADGMLLSLLEGSEAVGLYGVAYKVVELTMAFPIFFMSAVFPLTSSVADDTQKLDSLTAKAARALNLGAAPVVVGAVVLAPELVQLLGGKEFAGAALPLAILMFGNYFVYNNSAYGGPLLARNKQSQTLKIIGLVLCMNILLNLVAIPLAGPVGAAWVVVASEIVTLLMLRSYYRRYVGTPPSLRSNLPYALCALVMGAAVLAAKPMVDGLGLVGLSGLVLLGAMVYATLILVTRQYRISELRTLLGR